MFERMNNGLIKPFEETHRDLLRDESRRIGKADAIAFPKSEADVIAIMNQASGAITPQGARTGITAAAVPMGGTILNLSRMKQIGTIHHRRVHVQPGALLSKICETVEKKGLFFPPDPTETSASIGGMTACNASGALSFCYGSTRRWIQSLRVVLADGSVLALERGKQKATGRTFEIITEAGRTIQGTLPNYTMPAIKNAAGYFVQDNMDLLDLFIGMEGTLGIITELELKLIEKPKNIIRLIAFFSSEKVALQFIRIVRGAKHLPVAIEYFNPDALDLLRTSREKSFHEIPVLKPHFSAAIYLEFHGINSEILDEQAKFIFETMLTLGIEEEDCWFAESPRDLDALKAFRHAIPETVNSFIDQRKKQIPGLTKLSTDMSVPDSKLEAVMTLYNDGLKTNDLESVIFGHIGNNHLHVNILPRNKNDYEKAKKLYLFWAKKTIAMGGSVSAEHGIGKLKIPLLQLMIGNKGIAEIKKLKALFDPSGVLNPGTLISRGVL